MEGEGTAESTFEYAIPMILIRRVPVRFTVFSHCWNSAKISGVIYRGGCREATWDIDLEDQ
jgi:hypothetical protein